MENYRSQNNQCWNNFNNSFMDAINILSFIIGLQNLDLNVTAQDLDEQTNVILKEIHGHLEKQDRHLDDQDKRIERLENFVLMVSNDRKEKM